MLYAKLIVLVLPYFLYYIVFFSYAFTYKKISLKNDSIEFLAILRNDIVPFENFNDATLEILRMALIRTRNGNYSVLINGKTKDGLIKIITLSEKIINKANLIERIERLGNLFS
jgi:hypothetical protein